MLIGGKQGIEDMVAQAHRDHLRVVGLVLLQAEDLGRPGFCGDLVRRGMEQLIAGAVWQVRHAVHAVAHHAPVRRMRIANLRQILRRLIALDLITLLHGVKQMRILHFAVINQGRQRLDHLDRRGNPVALTDTDGNGIPLIPRFFMHPLFPLPARQHPGILFVKIDAGRLTVAKLA